VTSRNALAHSKGAKSDTIHRCTVPAPLFAFLMSAFPAFGGSAVGTATATCKDYENGSHQDMVDIVAAVHQALKADPNFGSLSQSELDSAIDKVCIPHVGAKVIDALGVKK
jgi:hypothetical protein